MFAMPGSAARLSQVSTLAELEQESMVNNCCRLDPAAALLVDQSLAFVGPFFLFTALC
jgi:hypothetical protein